MEGPLDAIAAGQYGLVTRQQALARMTSGQLDGRVARGQLVHVRDGVYRCEGTPESWEQGVLAVCLAGDAVASHRSAARVWGLEGVAALRYEVTVPCGRVVRMQGVRAHRSTLLGPEFLTVHRAIPLTTPARTLLDLSAVASAETVRKAVDDALRHGLVTLAEVERCLLSMAGRGRRRVAHFRSILESRQPGLEPGDSELEARVARWLVAAGLPRPVPQQPVLTNGHRYRLDLAYPESRIAIELDGWGAHSSRGAFDRDRARGNDLELAGWTLLRFTSASSRHEVIRTVEGALNRSSQRSLFTGIPS